MTFLSIIPRSLIYLYTRLWTSVDGVVVVVSCLYPPSACVCKAIASAVPIITQRPTTKY